MVSIPIVIGLYFTMPTLKAALEPLTGEKTQAEENRKAIKKKLRVSMEMRGALSMHTHLASAF